MQDVLHLPIIPEHPSDQGFTLIELSIVLVIIGLIVGGVLVGQDLVKAATLRAQITQIEQFNTAVNTFQNVYNCLPGDCANGANFGFGPRGAAPTLPGQGNGDGIIQGRDGGGAGTAYGGYYQQSGETVTFWSDLGTWTASGTGANLISGAFEGYETGTSGGTVTGAAISQWWPAARIGGGNYIYVSSGGITGTDGNNYFGIFAPTSIPLDQAPFSNPGLTVQQALAIDTKIDDGLPQTGQITAVYYNGNVASSSAVWAAGGGVAGASPGTAVSGSATTCYDNGNNAANPMQYSMAQSSGTGINCALSFQMQGAGR